MLEMTSSCLNRQLSLRQQGLRESLINGGGLCSLQACWPHTPALERRHGRGTRLPPPVWAFVLPGFPTPCKSPVETQQKETVRFPASMAQSVQNPQSSDSSNSSDSSGGVPNPSAFQARVTFGRRAARPNPQGKQSSTATKAKAQKHKLLKLLL